MDAHLKGVPGLGTLTTGGLAGGDLEGLGWETDGALDAEVLGLGTLNELGADLLEGVDLAGGEGDTDAVDFLEIYASVRYISRHNLDVAMRSMRVATLGIHTGPSPNSFSGFWKDILI